MCSERGELVFSDFVPDTSCNRPIYIYIYIYSPLRLQETEDAIRSPGVTGHTEEGQKRSLRNQGDRR